MPTLSNPELAEALEGANSLILRWGHNQMRQLKAEEVERIVAALKASASSETGPSLGLVHPGDNCPMCGEIKPIPRLSERQDEPSGWEEDPNKPPYGDDRDLS